ncbi:MAG: hypothetical protein FJ403_19675 [Verrucomicrobia bacterium]|nr:hypothetical protein [Verrucomicrobiota bacterium]
MQNPHDPEATYAVKGQGQHKKEHVDGAYVSGKKLTQVQAEGRELIGPAQPAPQKDGRFTTEDFQVKVEERTGVCPAGKTSTQCSRLEEEATGKVNFRFEFSFKYSVAHMYSIPNPPFIQPLLESLAPGRKTWLTVRNDDIYTFRFGDPAYAREYIANIPPADKIAGFYMGPDGYAWGRDFLEHNPEPGPRPLVMEKQWYSFMLWGRLAYDAPLPDSRFERILAARHPKASSHHLFRALQGALQVMLLTTRFFWGAIDLKWYPEACLSHPRNKGFYNVRDFMEGISMPGSEVLCIRDWRTRLTARKPMEQTTPLEIAGALTGSNMPAFATPIMSRLSTTASALRM